MKKIISWFKSYGYYYKWHFVFGLFALALLTILIVQIFTQTNYDIYLTYMGPGLVYTDSASKIAKTVEDVSKDEHTVNVRDIVYVNSELYEEYLNNDVYFSGTTNVEAIKLLNQEISVGDSYIFIIDKEQYENLKKENVFTPLSEITNNIPEGADEFGVPIKKTDFGNFFSVYSAFSNDMILCMKKNISDSAVSFFKGSDKENESYERHKKVFYEILSFKTPENN